MPMLHDPSFRRAIESRLDALRPDSPRQWGSMTVDQMLWHVNQFLAAALGDGSLPTQKSPIPAPVMRFFVIHMPWPKSAPMNKAAITREAHDFEGERARCRELIKRFANQPIDSQWCDDPNFGKVDGVFESKLHAKHLDHHFKQFGA